MSTHPIDLSRACVLVTGASSGIGLETSRLLRQHGATVTGTVRRHADGDALRDADCRVALLDVTEPEQVRAVLAGLPDLNVLVNNAAYSYRSSIEESDEQEVRRMYETNVFGLLDMLRVALPILRHNPPAAVINVSSVSGRVSLPLNGPYSSTKHAVEAITSSLAFEVEEHGVRVVAIEPGAVKTNFTINMRAEPRTYDDPSSPYRRYATAMAKNPPGGNAPEVIAREIVAALTAPGPTPVSWPASDDCRATLRQRREHDDVAFMALTKQRLLGE